MITTSGIYRVTVNEANNPTYLKSGVYRVTVSKHKTDRRGSLLTKCRNKAREFDSEILADCFRECIELTSRRSFRVFAVAGRF